MIGLILGTSEGKNIISLLNEFTEDIFISTATAYGGEILKKYKYKSLNTSPLDVLGLKKMILELGVSVLVDGSHPYAALITKNCKEACEDLKIKYLRYERPSIAEKYLNCDKFISVSSYEELEAKIKGIEEFSASEAVILNTTGSRNIDKLMALAITNRMVHRVLPSRDVMAYCFDLGVKVEDIIAIKGPVTFELNLGFIRQYNAKGIILKDSGKQGGTEEKIEAALHEKIYIFMLERKKEQFENIFYDEKQLVEYIMKNNLY